jgi:hypothetical protein
MGALEQWNEAVQRLLDAGLSSIDATDIASKENPGLWRQATAEVALTALRKSLRDAGAPPLDYRARTDFLRMAQAPPATGREAVVHVAHSGTSDIPDHTQGETMNASQQLLKMAEDMVRSGEAADLTEAVRLVGPSNQQLWGERRTETRKDAHPNQRFATSTTGGYAGRAPVGARPTSPDPRFHNTLTEAQPPSATTYTDLVKAHMAQDPRLSWMQAEESVSRTPEGKAAWQAHSDAMTKFIRGRG